MFRSNFSPGCFDAASFACSDFKLGYFSFLRRMSQKKNKSLVCVILNLRSVWSEIT